jgi:putative ABC transport system ATP-binding protein
MNSKENNQMIPAVLELRDVVKSHQQGKHILEVLKGVNLTVKTGEMSALVGQSGAGKSTLLQIAGLLDRPTKGVVYVNGENIARIGDDVRTGLRRDYVGFVYQYHNLLGDFSALENVMLPMLIKGIKKREAEEYAAFLLDKLKLSHRLKHRPAELSGGEQQRVSVARALAKRPEILFLDEPTGALDEETGRQVLDYISKLHRELGFTVIMITHNQNIAEMAKTVIKMNSGRIAEVYENPQQKTAYEIGW